MAGKGTGACICVVVVAIVQRAIRAITQTHCMLVHAAHELVSTIRGDNFVL